MHGHDEPAGPCSAAARHSNVRGTEAAGGDATPWRREQMLARRECRAKQVAGEKVVGSRRIMLGPFDHVPMDAAVSALPKAELHLHGEADGRLDRILARRAGIEPFDWTDWARRMVASVPPGLPRLQHWWASRRRSVEEIDRLDSEPENFIERVVDALDEAAADGAIYVEIRFGASTFAVPDFLALFREAERRTQQRWPRLRAEPLITGLTPGQPARWERVLPRCFEAAAEGLAGIDIIPDPYAA